MEQNRRKAPSTVNAIAASLTTAQIRRRNTTRPASANDIMMWHVTREEYWWGSYSKRCDRQTDRQTGHWHACWTRSSAVAEGPRDDPCHSWSTCCKRGLKGHSVSRDQRRPRSNWRLKACSQHVNWTGIREVWTVAELLGRCAHKDTQTWFSVCLL